MIKIKGYCRHLSTTQSIPKVLVTMNKIFNSTVVACFLQLTYTNSPSGIQPFLPFKGQYVRRLCNVKFGSFIASRSSANQVSCLSISILPRLEQEESDEETEGEMSRYGLIPFNTLMTFVFLLRSLSLPQTYALFSGELQQQDGCYSCLKKLMEATTKKSLLLDLSTLKTTDNECCSL